MKNKRKNNKSLLIKGALEKIPAEVIEDEAFRKKLRNMMKGWSGIYALYKDDRVYYIGKATSSFWRLWGHFRRDRHVGKWNKFSVFRFKRIRYLDDLESLLLHISKPKGNRAVARIPKDMALTSLLRKEIKESRKRAQKIEKAIKS
ncbi:MAG: GIY-YIG nuclease family protein [Nanoarchaeota archaeon]